MGLSRWVGNIGVVALGAALATASGAAAHAEPDLEVRPNVELNHNATSKIILNANLGYRGRANADVAEIRFPSAGYRIASWAQLWAGLLSLYTHEHDGERSFELRPFVGIKLSAPDLGPFRLSNYTRFEYRYIETLKTGTVQRTPRIRSMFNADFPLSARAWQPETFYGEVGAEIFHRFDKGGFFERVEARGRVGYIISESLKAEVTYRAVFTRSSPASDLARGTDILQFGFVISF